MSPFGGVIRTKGPPKALIGSTSFWFSDVECWPTPSGVVAIVQARSRYASARMRMHLRQHRLPSALILMLAGLVLSWPRGQTARLRPGRRPPVATSERLGVPKRLRITVEHPA